MYRNYGMEISSVSFIVGGSQIMSACPGYYFSCARCSPSFCLMSRMSLCCCLLASFEARLREDAARRQAALESRSATMHQDWTFQPTLSAASERVVGDSAWAGARHQRTERVQYHATHMHHAHT